MARRKQPKPIHQLTSAQFEKLFPDESACCAYLVARRWPNGVNCPRCGSGHVYELVCRVPWDLGVAAVTGPMNPQPTLVREPGLEPRGVVSASLDRRSENVRVLPVIITELEFGNTGKGERKRRNLPLSTNPRSMLQTMDTRHGGT
jgi:hypothetical protein